jgi:hypothetical protein
MGIIQTDIVSLQHGLSAPRTHALCLPFLHTYILVANSHRCPPNRSQVAITATKINQVNKMASKEDFEKTGATGGAKVHKIRITLTSRSVKNLEKCE